MITKGLCSETLSNILPKKSNESCIANIKLLLTLFDYNHNCKHCKEMKS